MARSPYATNSLLFLGEHLALPTFMNICSLGKRTYCTEREYPTPLVIHPFCNELSAELQWQKVMKYRACCLWTNVVLCLQRATTFSHTLASQAMYSHSKVYTLHFDGLSRQMQVLQQEPPGMVASQQQGKAGFWQIYPGLSMLQNQLCPSSCPHLFPVFTRSFLIQPLPLL